MCGPTARLRAQVRPSPRRRGSGSGGQSPPCSLAFLTLVCSSRQHLSGNTTNETRTASTRRLRKRRAPRPAVRLAGSRATRTTAEGPHHSLAQGPLRRRPSRARPASSRAGKVHTAGPRLDPRKGLPAGPASSGVWEPGFWEGAPRPRSLNDDGPLCINCSNYGLC